MLLKLRKNISGLGVSASYLEKHELPCLHSLPDIANHTGVFFSEEVLEYTQLKVLKQ